MIFFVWNVGYWYIFMVVVFGSCVWLCLWLCWFYLGRIWKMKGCSMIDILIIVGRVVIDLVLS